MKGLMVAIGKPEPEKGGPEREYAKEAYSALKDGDEDGFVEAFLGAVREKGGPEREYAKEAYSALKDGDEDGFVEAFISAVRACSKKSEADEYEDDEE